MVKGVNIMTKVCIVRHGETDWNSIGMLQGRTDISLNHLGLQQAKESRDYLCKFQWDVVVTSPLKRTKQTAEIINEKIGVPLIEMSEFIERGYGDAEGMTLQDRMAAFPDRNYPNQEDNSELNKRIIQGLNELNLSYKGKKILLVSHGGVINTILAILSNGEIGSGKTKLINASLSNIELVDNQWKIRDYNNVSHLSRYSEIGRI